MMNLRSRVNVYKQKMVHIYKHRIDYQLIMVTQEKRKHDFRLAIIDTN